MIKFSLLVFFVLTINGLLVDGMFDSYIDTISEMSLKELISIPKKSDEQFLYDLYHNDDSIQGRVNPLEESQIKLMDQVVGQAEMDEDWEKFLVAGPIVVNYLGNLMVLASKKDFPFNGPVNYLYRYIRYPNSFRGTLAQVSSEMYGALFGAHTSMDRIQTAVKQIPNHVKTVLKLLTSGSPLMIKKMLPLSINNIARLANESAKQANQTVEQFTNLLHLLDEISQLSITTGSANEILLENNEKQMNETMDKQQQLNQQLTEVQKQYKAIQIELEEARLAYKAAYEAIPTGGAVIISRPRVDFSEGSSRSITATIATVATVVSVIDSAVSVIGKIFGLGEKQKEPLQLDNSAHTNAMEKANLALQRLKDAEEAHRIQFELNLLEQNNLASIIREMAQLDLTKLTMEEIASILIKATKQIIDIREQWAKLVQYFSKVSIQADSTQRIVVSEFVDVIEATQLDNEPLSDADRAFFLELIIPTASLIDREAGLLYTMAATYYKVSGAYMLDQVAGVTALILTQTDDERHRLLQQNSNLTTSNSRKVNTLATQMRQQFVKDVHQLETIYRNYIEELISMEVNSIIG